MIQVITFVILYFQSVLNLTQYTPEDVDKLATTCQVAEQIKLLAAMNTTEFSIQKRVQLQAMQITGAQVKENICDWVSNYSSYRISFNTYITFYYQPVQISAVFDYNDVLEDESCVDQKLDEVCVMVQLHVRSVQS